MPLTGRFELCMGKTMVSLKPLLLRLKALQSIFAKAGYLCDNFFKLSTEQNEIAFQTLNHKNFTISKTILFIKKISFSKKIRATTYHKIVTISDKK